jgi:glycosyltransferase involved in cell wall biosynthesis
MDKNLVVNPVISVVMPVYNSGQLLNLAIESILDQTYTDYEFIIINDGSTDNTESVILSYTDRRIKYFKNPANLGIVASLNKGIELAKARYLARMDADDISLPERFEKQLHFMESNPEIAACGSQAYYINIKGIKTGQSSLPINDNDIKAQLFFRNTFIHPTTFFKTKVVKEIRYNPDYHYAEDYYLLAQISREYSIGNLNDPLLLYRVHDGNTTATKRNEMKMAHLKVLDYQISFFLNKKANTQFMAEFYALAEHDFQAYNLSVYICVLKLLLKTNIENKKYDPQAFRRILHLNWYELLRKKGGKYALSYFLRSELSSRNDVTFKQIRRIFKTSLKSLLD